MGVEILLELSVTNPGFSPPVNEQTRKLEKVMKAVEPTPLARSPTSIPKQN
ncbi:hypothetical protein A2U01_0085521, partial [Trifolium medium]|nr:hypothetical protein [Trifolium medium]